MERIQVRDADAFDALAARYSPALQRHIEAVVRDTAATDDLLQEVLLRVWTRADQWEGRGVRSWLFRIATNLALNHLRTTRRRRESPLEPRSAPTAYTSECAAPSWMMDPPAARPEQQVVRAERRRRLRRLVGALPEDKRAVVALAFEEDLGLREVAERLGIPEGTAKSRLHYARKWLAEQWNAYEAEGEEWL